MIRHFAVARTAGSTTRTDVRCTTRADGHCLTKMEDQSATATNVAEIHIHLDNTSGVLHTPDGVILEQWAMLLGQVSSGQVMQNVTVSHATFHGMMPLAPDRSVKAARHILARRREDQMEDEAECSVAVVHSEQEEEGSRIVLHLCQR